MATIKYKNGNTWTQIVAQDVDAVSTTITDTQYVQGFLQFPRYKHPYTIIPGLDRNNYGTPYAGLNSAFAGIADEYNHDISYLSGGASGTEGKLYTRMAVAGQPYGAENLIINYIDVMLTEEGDYQYAIASPYHFRKALNFGGYKRLDGTNTSIGTGTTTLASMTFSTSDSTLKYPGLWIFVGHCCFGTGTTAGHVALSISKTVGVGNAALGTISVPTTTTNPSKMIINSWTTSVITQEQIEAGNVTYYFCQNHSNGSTTADSWSMEAYLLG